MTSIIPAKDSKAYARFRASQRYTDLMVSHFCAASASHSHIDELEDVLRGIYDGSIVTPALIRQHRGPERKLSANAPVWFNGSLDEAQKDALINETLAISKDGKTADLANLALDTLFYIDQDATDHLRREHGIKRPQQPLFRLNLTGSTGALRFEDAALEGDFRHSEFSHNCYSESTLTNCNFYKATQHSVFTRNTHFQTCFYDNATLTQSLYNHCSFHDSMFVDATLNNVTFRDCVFTGCDFSKATFSRCTFDNCQFIDCNMKDAKLVHETTFKGSNSALNGIKHADYITCGADVIIDDSLPRTTDDYDIAHILRSEIALQRSHIYDGKVGYQEPHRDPDQAKHGPSAPSGQGVQAATHDGRGAQDPELARLIAEGEAAGKVARFPARGGGSGKQ